jgi:hypothetical protein
MVINGYLFDRKFVAEALITHIYFVSWAGLNGGHTCDWSEFNLCSLRP